MEDQAMSFQKLFGKANEPNKQRRIPDPVHVLVHSKNFIHFIH